MEQYITVYQTDYDGRYVGEIQLGKGDKCPKTGVYLVPGGCVEETPPEIPDDKELFWYNSEWALRDMPLEAEEDFPSGDLRLEEPQIYFGEDAKLKYEEIKHLLPDTYPYIWGPEEVTEEPSGGRLEIFDVDYDSNKDQFGIEWNNCTKGIAYNYKDGMKWFNRVWRIRA